MTPETGIVNSVVLSRDALNSAALHRPAGYIDDVLAHAAEVTDSHVVLTQKAYTALLEKYAGFSHPTIPAGLFAGHDPGTAASAGPGTELSALLADWLGIVSSPACGCRAMAARMDAMGPEWCESDEGMAEIIGVMRTEHGKRRAAGQTMLPWTDVGAKTLVRLACRRARAKAAAVDT